MVYYFFFKCSKKGALLHNLLNWFNKTFIKSVFIVLNEVKLLNKHINQFCLREINNIQNFFCSCCNHSF